MNIKINKINKDVKLPMRFFNDDAGADVYVLENINIEPHTTVSLPAGFSIDIPKGFMGILLPRSSTSIKGLNCPVVPIDSGYKGEIHSIICNTTNKTINLKKDDRIAQLVIIPILICTFHTEDNQTRGTGSFGSTNKK